ncbi:MAG: aminotransferase class V-fold PLP-dependent enzyme [Acidobacteria bacterium]|nr:aminotransferase class V-fold PLP-dependent enzyme [Acidobacteriota bacterium]
MLGRRTFLNGAVRSGTGALIAAVFNEKGLAHAIDAVRYVSGRTAEEAARDEDFWLEVQRAFTVDRTLINLNNGGVSPSPRIVQEAMRRYLEYSNHAPTYTMWRVLDPGIETVRRRLARNFGCDPEEIAITRNASESLENCQLGLDLRPGDEVLTTNQDYPRMLTAWRQRANRDGIVLRQISIPIRLKRREEIVDIFARHITPRTRVMHFCHITNLSGQIYPVRELCQLARSRGIHAIVDGAHAYAHFPFQHSDLDCDYYGTSLHKWLTAPFGTGMLFVRREKIPQVWSLMASEERNKADIRKFEEIGTHPSANALAINEALDFYEGIGAERKAARLRYLFHRWAKRLEVNPRVRIHTSYDPEQSCGLTLFDVEGIDLSKLAIHLEQNHRIITTLIIHDEFRGLRITPNVYTTVREIDIFAETVERYIEKQGKAS